MSDRIFVDQRASTEAPFVAVVTVEPDGTSNEIPTYYESIDKNSMWGIHPTGYVYWTDGIAPLLEAARMVSVNGKLVLEYVIGRYPATSTETVNAGFTQKANVAVATTVASSAGALLTAQATTIGHTTVLSRVVFLDTSLFATVARSTTTSTVDASIDESFITRDVSTGGSTVDAALGQQARVVAFSKVPSGVDAALSAAANTASASAATTTVGAGFSLQAKTIYTAAVSTRVNAAVSTTPIGTTTALTSVDANLVATPLQSLASENFTGSDGSVWPSKWTPLLSGNGSSLTIQSNTGRIVTSASAYVVSAAAYLNTITVADFNLAFDIAFANLQEQYLTFGGRRASSTGDALAGSGYFVEFFPHNGVNSFGVNKNATGTDTDVSGDLPGGQFVANVFMRVRFQVTGTQLRVKSWDPTGPEPAAWLWTGTDNSIVGTGRIGLSYMTGGGGASQTAFIDNIVVS